MGDVLTDGLAYTYDALDRPVSRGSDTFAYNARGEVVLSCRDAVNAENAYAYDDIGNLLYSADNSATNTYVSNNRNQYASILRNSATPRETSYDLDGNLTRHGEWTYTYDSGNRLVSVSSNGPTVATFAYDAQGRRVKKVAVDGTHRYFYDGWLLVYEHVVHSNNTTNEIEYIWGKDLSGTRSGAAGIGGLLYLRRDGVIYVPWYDAYGNILGYCDAQGNIVAQYTYDAFGNIVSSSGAMTDAFLFRFSTKYFDADCGLYYYGYRYYKPLLMRWLTEDPTGVDGGMNLYAMCDNTTFYSIDALGLSKYWDNYMNFDKYRTSQVWEKVGGNIYWMHLTDPRYENSCALRVSRALINSGETIPVAKGRWVATDYIISKDTMSRQGILFKKGTVLNAERSGSRYELSAEKMKSVLDGIFTGEKLKEKKHLVQNSKALEYAKRIANCNDEAFFVGYSTEGRWWHAGMVKKGYQDPHLFRGLMYVTFWRLKK